MIKGLTLVTVLLLAVCVIIDDQRIRELEEMHDGVQHIKGTSAPVAAATKEGAPHEV